MKYFVFMSILLVSATAASKTFEQELKELDTLFKEVIEQYQVETDLPVCPIVYQTYGVECA